MKTKITSLITAGILGTALASQAAIITWDDAVTMSGDTDVSTEGTSEYAYSLNGANGTKALNGVDFTIAAEGANGVFDNLTSSVNASQGATAFASTTAPWASLSTAYKDVLQGGIYNGADDTTYTLNDLTGGQDYLVQMWITNPSNNTATRDRTASFYGEANNISTTAKVIDYNVGNVGGGLGQYIIGTFTTGASDTSISFLAEGGGAAPGMQLNAIQVRAIPEPSSFALLGGLLALGHVMVRRRR